MRRVVLWMVSSKPPKLSVSSARMATISLAAIRNVSRPSAIRSAISTASIPLSSPPSGTSGAASLPARSWMNADPSSPSDRIAASESVRTSACRSSRTRMRTTNRPPGASGMSMPITSPAGRPDNRTLVPISTPATLPKSASISNCSLNNSRRSPIMNRPTAKISSPPMTKAPTSARRGDPI